MDAIVGKNISHDYGFDEGHKLTLDNISISIRNGELVSILGHNGCGKSTLIRHLNGLIEIQSGSLHVAGFDVGDKSNLREIRRKIGLVFQNPENQFVSSIIEEDIAFGLENFETPEEEISKKVTEALAQVGMEGFELKSPHLLSGGQKQRIALAGVLAMEPDIIIFDEATAMLDPEGRRDILTLIKDLHKKRGHTIIMVTHCVEEAVMADRILLLNSGRLIAEGSPEEIFSNTELLLQTGLIPPLSVRLFNDLKAGGIALRKCPLTHESLVEELCLLN
ncbi:MAG TPA: energy-coupling factor transporter ATPase [Treponemataceae bacterium]|nr:energy-coupling factor transporter ATPase [Treponemataceae bacterium]